LIWTGGFSIVFLTKMGSRNCQIYSQKSPHSFITKKTIKPIQPNARTKSRKISNFFQENSYYPELLSRLVEEGSLIRIANGMFVCALTKNANYSDLEIATLKASSFGKRIHQHGADAAASLGLEVEKKEEQQEEPSFIVSGCTSKFRIAEGMRFINLRTACAKKMFIENNLVGKVVRALWHFGEGKVARGILARALAILKREDCRMIMNSCAWMPYWLSDMFIEVFQNRFGPDFRPPQMSAG